HQYGQLVALCQFLPGPASSQVGFALGLMRGGFLGALAAWVAFTLPSALLLILFALGASIFDGPISQGIITGLKAVAVAVVAHAVLGMAKTLTPDLRRIIIGVIAVLAALFFPGTLGQLVAITIGLVVGLVWCRNLVSSRQQPLLVKVSKRVGTLCAALFLLLIIGLPILAAATNTLWVDVTDAFYRAGALVFGGGHVVLPLLQAEPAISSAVAPDQFLAGYGAAQAVPGPLFTFAAFLGFEMGTGPQAWLTAGIALIAVFLPGLLLLGAVLLLWNMVQNTRWVQAAVAGANAAVVGVLAAALITPISTSGLTGLAQVLLAVTSFVLLSWAKIPAWVVVLLGVLVGVLLGVTGWGVE